MIYFFLQTLKTLEKIKFKYFNMYLLFQVIKSAHHIFYERPWAKFILKT